LLFFENMVRGKSSTSKPSSSSSSSAWKKKNKYSYGGRSKKKLYACGSASNYFRSPGGAREGRLLDGILQHKIKCLTKCFCNKEVKNMKLTERRECEKLVEGIFSFIKQERMTVLYSEKSIKYKNLRVRMDLVLLNEDKTRVVYMDIKRNYKIFFTEKKSRFISDEQKEKDMEKHKFQIACCGLTWNKIREENLKKQGVSSSSKNEAFPKTKSASRYEMIPMTHSYLYYTCGPHPIKVHMSEWHKHVKKTESMWNQK